VFKNADELRRVADSFALLGAVDAAEVQVRGADATRLTLIRLKPGVTENDVMALARELGLNDLSLL
jgi:hypothetical protein